MVALFGCATAVTQLDTSTGKPEVVVNSTKEAVAEYITSQMLTWDYMIKNQTGNVLVFYKSTTYPAPIFPIWDTTPRPGEYRITYNLVSISSGIRVMTSIIGVKNPNTAYETQEEDLSKGSRDAVNVQTLLDQMKTSLESAPAGQKSANAAAPAAPKETNKPAGDTKPAADSAPPRVVIEGIGIITVGNTIASLIAEGPADQAGIKKGDVITMIDGDPVAENFLDSAGKLAGKTGTSVVLTLKRGEQAFVIPVIRKNP